MLSDIAEKYPIGSRPAIAFVPYLIFCSYLVSLIGAFTTVELLQRRVSGPGWRSWVQVAGCAVSFGLVAIWCMHFVGNRAIVLGAGEEAIQLYYSPTYTTVSAILPVVVIFIGLLAADRFYRGSQSPMIRFASLLICGVCAGAAVTEMHYLGNNGTTNYRLQLNLPHVVGAAGIAVGACLLSFGLFFHWSKHWMNNIWRRVVVACFLALAVSGMHWTAAAGTLYEIRGYHEGPGREKNINLIISLCLGLSACVVCFLLGFLNQREQKMLKDRAQQVVLAVAIFDTEGRLLVSQSGLMPCQTITQQFHQRTFDDEFNTSHPVFQWLFRVSKNWGGISDLIPSMREHLEMIGFLQASSATQGGVSRTSFGSHDNTSYSSTFRELFCVTAHEIAKNLDTSLNNLGCLYEEVLTTGTLARTLWQSTHGNKKIVAADVAISTRDIEAGIINPILFGKGQMLVLTKQVDTKEANRLQNLGYGFASIEKVSDQLSRSLQVSRDNLENLVGRLHSYSTRKPFVPESSTYIASFIIQPSTTMKGLEVIVPRATPDRLPMVKLSDDELNIQQMKIINTFNGLSLDDCLMRIASRPRTISTENSFLETFRNRIYDLVRDCPEQTLHRATFSAQRLDVAHGMIGQQDSSQATVFAFCGIREIYIQSLQSLTLRTIPLSFFQTYLRSYPGCPDHAIFAQKNHKEFGSLQRVLSITKPLATHQSNKWPSRLRIKKSQSVDMTVRPDSCSEKGLVNASSPTETTSHPWGGIMVTSTQDIIIDEPRDGGDMEMRELGVKAEVGIAETEQQTMADKLMSITTAFRDPHTSRALPKDLYYGSSRR
ncbi:Nn.00g063440.m01.CDS01 [Neocucurbitaria sp. VM-36]